jgi:hypothetical protein
VKCPKGHRRGDKRCGGRCGRRWYYVLNETLDEGKRRRLWSRSFPSENEARAALTAEMARRNQGIMLSAERVSAITENRGKRSSKFENNDHRSSRLS